MAKEDSANIQTQVVHAGEGRKMPAGEPTSMPIYASATYTYESMAEMDRVFAGESPGYVYTRHGNPTTDALADALRSIEGGVTACAYASGMAALHAALLSCDLKSGATVLASQDLYGATTSLLQTILTSFNVKTVTADFNNLDQVHAAARQAKPQVILAETISNPLLKVCDIDACARIAQEIGARLIIDNTFASPVLCQPLKHGADIVMHSATKFLGGHADSLGGVVISRHKTDAESLVRTMKLVGGVLSPYEAHQILRGTKTLAVRMERHCENAAKLAAQVSSNPRIARIYYPELESAERRDIAKRILRGGYFGALVSIELAENTRDAAFQFMDALKLCIRSTSLGDVFTSVLHPASASHRDLPIERRTQLGITEGLIRISVGIENLNDIIADIEQALNAVSASGAAAS